MTTYYAIPTTWNPLDKGSGVTLSGGNLITTGGASNGSVRSVDSVTSGIFYWEESVDNASNAQLCGVANALAGYNSLTSETHAWVFYPVNGNKYIAGSGSSYGSACTTGDVIGFLLNMGAGTLELFKITAGVSTSMGVMATGLVGPLFAISGGDSNGVATTGVANFGPTFAGPLPAGAYAGFGALGIVGTANLDPINGALPLPVIEGYGGATAAMTLPTPIIVGYQSVMGSFSLPSLTLSATAHDSLFDQYASFSLPSLALVGYGGANANMSMPSLVASLSGTVTGLGTLNATMPSLSLNATGTTTALAEASFTFGSDHTYKLVGYTGAVLSVTLTDGYSMDASGTTGGIAEASMTLPMFDLVATGTAQNHGSADMLLPMLRSVPGAVAWMTLPGLQLVAVGTAVVTATYEAYALNLNHNDPNANDEMTRYTNFPFTHIVRYQGSYFGVNSTGLYLLEGTTDYADPVPTKIPWAFKTAMTDFKSPFIKTVVSAYFAGRLGPTASVQLYVGENVAKTYSYTCPRGDHAQNYRQKFGRGIEYRYYALGASGTGTLALDAIEFNAINTTRRI